MFLNIGRLLTHIDELRIFASENKPHITVLMKQSSSMVKLKLTNIK